MGNVSACCYSGEHKVGNVSEASIEEIWNGPEMRRWRREFLEDRVEICAGPMRTFNCHRNYQHLAGQVVRAEIQKDMPRRLDLRLNGRCNLECVMCDVWRQPNGLYDASDFWTVGPERIFPFLLEVDMLGGEPFIQKDTYRLIDEVLKVNPHCSWGFITNGQYRVTDHLMGYLERLRLRHIHVSVDSADPEIYSRIRRKGLLAKTIETIDHFAALRDRRSAAGQGFALFASMCVQKENWDGIPGFLEFCDARGAQPIFQLVIGRDLAFRNLARPQLEQMAASLERFRGGKHEAALAPVVSEIVAVLGRSSRQ